MAWVCKNANREREKAERRQYRENKGIQGARGALQTDPILDKHKHCDAINKTHQQKHSEDG